MTLRLLSAWSRLILSSCQVEHDRDWKGLCSARDGVGDVQGATMRQDLPPMLPPSKGSPLEVSPWTPDCGSSELPFVPHTMLVTAVAALDAVLLMVSISWREGHWKQVIDGVYESTDEKGYL